MDQPDIPRIIRDSLGMINESRPEETRIDLTGDADIELFGAQGHLDSMDLVNLLIDVEDALLDADIELTLNDERAMSEKSSPFRSISTLTNYIESRLTESSLTENRPTESRLREG